MIAAFRSSDEHNGRGTPTGGGKAAQDALRWLRTRGKPAAVRDYQVARGLTHAAALRRFQALADAGLAREACGVWTPTEV